MVSIGAQEIAQTTPLGSAIAAVVREAYGLDVEHCSLFRRAFNLVYGLALRDGTRAVARLSSARPRGPANLEYEAALLDHLKLHGTQVAAAIRTDRGDAFVPVQLPEGVRPLMLFEHLTGDTPGPSLENVQATGRSLAELHVAAARFEGPESLYRLELAYLLDAPLERLLRTPNMAGELASRFETLARRIGDRISSLELQRVRCHGDCHGANNFMVPADGGDLKAAFFDFDDSGPGFLAYELSVFLWANVPHKVGVVDEDAWKRWGAYLAGYRTVRAIPSNDLEAIPLFMAVRQFWLMGEYAGRADTWGSQVMTPGWLRLQPALIESWMALTMPHHAHAAG